MYSVEERFKIDTSNTFSKQIVKLLVTLRDLSTVF